MPISHIVNFNPTYITKVPSSTLTAHGAKG